MKAPNVHAGRMTFYAIIPPQTTAHDIEALIARLRWRGCRRIELKTRGTLQLEGRTPWAIGTEIARESQEITVDYSSKTAGLELFLAKQLG